MLRGQGWGAKSCNVLLTCGKTIIVLSIKCVIIHDGKTRRTVCECSRMLASDRQSRDCTCGDRRTLCVLVGYGCQGRCDRVVTQVSPLSALECSYRTRLSTPELSEFTAYEERTEADALMDRYCGEDSRSGALGCKNHVPLSTRSYVRRSWIFKGSISVRT